MPSVAYFCWVCYNNWILLGKCFTWGSTHVKPMLCTAHHYERALNRLGHTCIMTAMCLCAGGWGWCSCACLCLQPGHQVRTGIHLRCVPTMSYTFCYTHCMLCPPHMLHLFLPASTSYFPPFCPICVSTPCSTQVAHFYLLPHLSLPTLTSYYPLYTHCIHLLPNM